jgi:hypothetical protein
LDAPPSHYSIATTSVLVHCIVRLVDCTIQDGKADQAFLGGARLTV